MNGSTGGVTLSVEVVKYKLNICFINRTILQSCRIKVSVTHPLQFMFEVEGTDALLVRTLFVLIDLCLQRLDFDLQVVFLLLKVTLFFFLFPPGAGEKHF